VQPRQQRRQAQRGRGFHGAYAQRARRPGAALQQGQRFIVVGQHAACVALQQAACRRGVHGRAALQQLHAGLVLELFHVGRDIGLHGVQLLGGGAEAAAVADGQEHAQGLQLHRGLLEESIFN
jgi:hypothetical protein